MACLNQPGTKCSDDSQYPDLFSRLYKFCNKGTLRDDTVCSDKTMVNFQAIGNVSVINITNMTFGDSCSYRVFTKCGFPEIVVNSSEVDIFVASLDKNNSQFNPNVPDDDEVTNDMFEQAQSSNGKTTFQYPGSNVKDDSCGKMRRMYVTLTRIAPETPKESRMLAAVEEGYYSLQFSAFQAAFSLATSFTFIAAVLASVTF